MAAEKGKWPAKFTAKNDKNYQKAQLAEVPPFVLKIGGAQ